MDGVRQTSTYPAVYRYALLTKDTPQEIQECLYNDVDAETLWFLLDSWPSFRLVVRLLLVQAREP